MKGFPDFEQFYVADFSARTQNHQVRCVYLFRHARISYPLQRPRAISRARVSKVSFASGVKNPLWAESVTVASRVSG